MKNKVDVLNLEFTSFPSRDRIIGSLVSNYLRFQGYTVRESTVFNSFHEINNYAPKVLFISNAIGAMQNLEAVKYAKRRGIKVVTAISEGIITDYSQIDIFLWGINTSKIMDEDINLHWTRHMRSASIEKYPELKDKIRISGAIGFDNYPINKTSDKAGFLKKYQKKQFEKIIGIGCWDFGIIDKDDPRFEINFKLYNNDWEIIRRFENDKKKFNDILLQLVNANPDKLFLIKLHPGMLGGFERAGIEGLQNMDNVIIIKTEEPIFKCLSVSDLWIAYESTTTMEGWLLGKTTFLINPGGPDFPRPDFYKGSVVYDNFNALNAGLNEYFTHGHVRAFDDLENYREEIITEFIGFKDGLNHVRAGNEIIQFLNGITSSCEETMQDHAVRVYRKFKWDNSLWLSKIKKSFAHMAWRKREFSFPELNTFSSELFLLQTEFYKANNMNQETLKEIHTIK